jgi:hypothetical protein
MLRIVALLAVLAAVPAAAQVQSRPTDPPIVTAANESWYQLGEPVQFAGDVYYRAGAAVFFNGNTMVRTGHYNGVPLYADTTIEPYSMVLVPIGRGLLQPYERPRRGTLAGTTGSRTPSFAGRVLPETGAQPVAQVSPTSLPVPVGAVSVSSSEVAGTTGTVSTGRTPGAVGTAGVIAVRPQSTRPIESLRRPENNDGVWVSFGGEKWVSDGVAVQLSTTDFVQVGQHAGFPVYARRELKEEKIYLPTRTGLVAPYRLKD